MKIFKYDITEVLTTGKVDIEIPETSFRIRSIQFQGNALCAWIEVDADWPVMKKLRLVMIGTGHTVPKGARYLETVQHGPFVWHIHFLEGQKYET